MFAFSWFACKDYLHMLSLLEVIGTNLALIHIRARSYCLQRVFHYLCLAYSLAGERSVLHNNFLKLVINVPRKRVIYEMHHNQQNYNTAWEERFHPHCWRTLCAIASYPCVAARQRGRASRPRGRRGGEGPRLGPGSGRRSAPRTGHESWRPRGPAAAPGEPPLPEPALPPLEPPLGFRTRGAWLALVALITASLPVPKQRLKQKQCLMFVLSYVRGSVFKTVDLYSVTTSSPPNYLC